MHDICISDTWHIRNICVTTVTSCKPGQVFSVPCSAFRVWGAKSSATGITIVVEQPDIVEDMSALIEEFEEFKEFEKSEEFEVNWCL